MLLSGFAFQAVEAERRARLAERSSRLQGEARGLVDALDDAFRRPALEVQAAVARLRLTSPRDAAEPLDRLVDGSPLLRGFSILDAEGQRVYPAGQLVAGASPWAASAGRHFGGGFGAAVAADPMDLLRAAQAPSTHDPDERRRLLERAAQMGHRPARVAALYDLGLHYESGGTMSGLLNAKEAYGALAGYPIELVCVRGRLAPALGRLRLALVQHAFQQPAYREQLEALLADLDASSLHLPSDSVVQLSERAAALLEDPAATAAAGALAARREQAEARQVELDNLFGHVLQGAVREATGSRQLGGGSLEGALEPASGVPFVKARHRDGIELLTYALLPGPPAGAAPGRGSPLGLVAVQVDVAAARAAFEVRARAHTGDGSVVAWEAGADLDEQEVARARLRAPFDHLGVEVRARPEEPSMVEDALDLPRETVQLWAITLAVGGILAGVFVTTRTLARETKAAQLKSDFVSNVTHELKTPLTSIRMFIETLMLGRVTDEEEAQEFLQVMNRETQRLTRLIEQLLVFSRIEGRKWRVRFSSEDPRDLIEEAIRVLAVQLGSSPEELAIEVVAVQDLPPIPVDRFAVVEALLNLLHNAWKYSPQPDRQIRVVATARRRQLEIAIEDNGMGVPRRDRRRVFVKFERGSNAEETRVEGSGIGLTLASEIVKAHGGKVVLTALKPRGSRFAVILPR